MFERNMKEICLLAFFPLCPMERDSDGEGQEHGHQELRLLVHTWQTGLGGKD